jgi:hypothetical protein
MDFPTIAQTAQLPVRGGTTFERKTRHRLPSGRLPRVIPSNRPPTRPASGPRYRPARGLMLRLAKRAEEADHTMLACTSPNWSHRPKFACGEDCIGLRCSPANRLAIRGAIPPHHRGLPIPPVRVFPCEVRGVYRNCSAFASAPRKESSRHTPNAMDGGTQSVPATFRPIHTCSRSLSLLFAFSLPSLL